MIKEFAIQPQVMATWRHFRELRDDFGVGRGRLVSVFPWDWKEKVRSLAQAQNQDIKAAAILSHLHAYLYRGEHCFIRTRMATCKSNDEWLEKAEQSTAPSPFHAIISTTNPRKHAGVLVAGEFERTAEPFAVRTQLDVPRRPEALADCCGLLLEHCDEFKIIDPHFDSTNRAFTNTFEVILEKLGARNRKLKRLELHVSCSDGFNKSNQQANYHRAFSRLLSKQNTMRVVFWRDLEQGFHARYLLTELGGVKFDWGFDQGNSPQHLNEVVLLEHRRFEEVTARFTAPDAQPTARCEVISLSSQPPS